MPPGDDEAGAGVVEGALAEHGQVFLREIDHARVDLDHRDMFDRAVPEHFARHAAVAAADDQRAAGRSVGDDRHMGHHLVVDEVVALGGLDHVVEGEDTAEGGVLEDADALVVGLAVIEQLAHPERLRPGIVERFADPVGHGRAPVS